MGEAEDEKIINIGRHKGLAGHPAYLCGWRINALARMDEWEGYFKSPAGRVDYPELAALQGLDFVRCGLYDELISGRLEDDAMHFVEYFDAGAEVTDEVVREHFSQRANNYDVECLAFLLRRVGLLGPAQGDVAIWSLPDFASAEAIIPRIPPGRAATTVPGGAVQERGTRADVRVGLGPAQSVANSSRSAGVGPKSSRIQPMISSA